MEAYHGGDSFPGALVSQAAEAVGTSFTSYNSSPPSRRARLRRSHSRGHAWELVFPSAVASIAAVALLISMCSRSQMRSHAFHYRDRRLSANGSPKDEFQSTCGEDLYGEEVWLVSDDGDSDTDQPDQPLQKKPRLVEEAGEGSESTKSFEGSQATGEGLGVTTGPQAEGSSQGYSSPLRPSRKLPAIAAMQWRKNELDAAAALFELRIGPEYMVNVDQLSGLSGKTMYVQERAGKSETESQRQTKLAGKILRLATFVNIAEPAAGPSSAPAAVTATGTVARAAAGPAAEHAVGPAVRPAAGHLARPSCGAAARLPSGTAAASAARAATGPTTGPSAGSVVGPASGPTSGSKTGSAAGNASGAAAGKAGGPVSERLSELATGTAIESAPESAVQIFPRPVAGPADAPLPGTSTEEGYPPLTEHPFVRLPTIGSGGRPVRFSPAAAQSELFAPQSPTPLLCTAYELLRKPHISAEEFRTLVRTAEQLVSHSIVYQTRGVPVSRPGRAAGVLGLRFLIFDVVVSTFNLLGYRPEGAWWDRFTSRVPHLYSNQFQDRYGRVDVIFNRQISQRLMKALDILKTGERAPPEETVQLKQLLFSSVYSPLRFQHKRFDAWRTDSSPP